jgi:hypothetical protein
VPAGRFTRISGRPCVITDGRSDPTGGSVPHQLAGVDGGPRCAFDIWFHVSPTVVEEMLRVDVAEPRDLLAGIDVGELLEPRPWAISCRSTTSGLFCPGGVGIEAA